MNILKSKKAPILVPLVVSSLICALTYLFAGVPNPNINDEFAYLMQADTFLHGRLANPTHPLWKSFEALHIYFQPTYSAQYQPGSALMLAAGKWLFGQEIFGVWIGSVLAVAAVGWALAGMMELEAATLGGVTAALLLSLSYWSFSFWGGSLTALGGALFIGGLVRLLRPEAKARDALAMSAGISILQLTRPFEGLVLILCATLFSVFFRRPALTGALKHICREPVFAACALGPVALSVGFQMIFDRAVTGSLWRLPYLANPYTHVPPLLFLPLGQPHPGLNPEFQWFYQVWDQHQYVGGRYAYWKWFFGRLRYTLIPFYFEKTELALWGAAIAVAAFREKLRLNGLVVACFLGFVMTVAACSYAQAHYVAPFFVIFVYLIAQAMRQLQEVFPSRAGIRRAVTVGLLVLIAVPRLMSFSAYARSFPTESWKMRTQILQTLQARGGKHVVLIEFGPPPPPADWVRNSADIDSSAVVWARMLGAEQDQKVREYYPDRQFWVLDLKSCTARFKPLLGSEVLLSWKSC